MTSQKLSCLCYLTQRGFRVVSLQSDNNLVVRGCHLGCKLVGRLGWAFRGDVKILFLWP